MTDPIWWTKIKKHFHLIKSQKDKANKQTNGCFYRNSNIFKHIILDSSMETIIDLITISNYFNHTGSSSVHKS